LVIGNLKNYLPEVHPGSGIFSSLTLMCFLNSTKFPVDTNLLTKLNYSSNGIDIILYFFKSMEFLLIESHFS
jgi:hypothetical protein